MGTTPEALGNVTASKMMEEMSPNGDGRISPRDFGWWLSEEGSSKDILRSTAEGFACDSPGDDTDADEKAQADGNVQGEGGSVHAGLWGDQLEGQGHVVMRARKLLCLDCFNVNDLLEILAEAEVMVSFGSNMAFSSSTREMCAHAAVAPVNEILLPHLHRCKAPTKLRLPQLLVPFTQPFLSACILSPNACFVNRETGQSGPG